MPRIERTDVGGYVYHVINRANARAQIFDSDKDYQLFENILEEAAEKFGMRIYLIERMVADPIYVSYVCAHSSHIDIFFLVCYELAYIKKTRIWALICLIILEIVRLFPTQRPYTSFFVLLWFFFACGYLCG